MQRTLLGVAAAGALLATLTGCADSTAATTGRLSVMLTDAPFPFDDVARADMHVVRIDARLAESSEAEAAALAGTEDDAELENHDPRRGWVTVATPDRTIDLLALQNGTTTNLGQVVLPTGRYRGFRLVLDTDRSSVTLKDGTVLQGNAQPGIVWPSAGRSGVKLNLAQAVNLVESGTVLVVDFDLGNSFVLRGNVITENGLLFKPVIRATARDVTGSVAGTLRCASASDAAGTPVVGGSVELLKAGTTLTDTDPANVVSTSTTDVGGEFRFAYALPGSYALRATRPDGEASCVAQTLVESVGVTTGEAAAVAVVLPAK
jgi:hypothetical protein